MQVKKIVSTPSHQDQLRILMITDILGPGGKERRMVQLIKNLSESYNCDCGLVVLSNDIHYREVEEMDVKLVKLPRRHKRDPSILTKLYHTIRKFKPHIIQSWESMATLYALPISKLFKTKFVNASVASSQDIVFGSKEWIRSKLTYPWSDAIVGNSLAGLEAFSAPRNKSYCIYNGFDFNRLSHLSPPEEVRAEFGINTQFVVGMVGAFHPRKDYHTFVEAAQAVLTQRNDVTFVAVGEGELLEPIQNNLRDEFREHIIFTGKQSKVESIINVFNIGVLTTNQNIHGEGISNAIMEYMVLGKPVIATNGGGTPEIVQDQKTGYLVPAFDSPALVDKIQILLDNPHIASAMGSRGKQLIQEEFSIDNMTEKFVRLYKSLLNK